MHELSLVTSIVETVTETLAALPDAQKGARVLEVRLRVGALASVIPESLEFCWGIVSEGTPLEGSRLVVCPRCGEPCSDMRQGRELEIDSIEIEDGEVKA